MAADRRLTCADYCLDFAAEQPRHGVGGVAQVALGMRHVKHQSVLATRGEDGGAAHTLVRRARMLRSAAVLGLALVSACSFRAPIMYQPIADAAEDPLTTVKLQVIDAREGDAETTDPSEIGRLRGLFGNSFPLYESGAQSVRAVVHDATADALHLARVGMYEHSPRTLVATVKKFWIDGYFGYKATVTVQCDLHDEQGTVLWTSVVTGEGGGVNWAGPGTFVRATFQRALAAYVEKAGGEFSSTDFQKHVF